MQTAEAFLVKAGDVQPGAVVAALDRMEAEWAALKLEHRKATEGYSQAQVALTEALDNEQTARAAAAAANDELKRIAQLDLDPKILAAAIAAAQQLSDERAAALAEATTATNSARAKLSHASRKMKRLEDALEQPATAIPAGPIDPPALPSQTAEPVPEPIPAEPSDPEPEPPETAEPTPEPEPEPEPAPPTKPEPPTKADDAPISTTTADVTAPVRAGASKERSTPVTDKQPQKPAVAVVFGGMLAVVAAGFLVLNWIGSRPAEEASAEETVAAKETWAVQDAGTAQDSATDGKPGDWLLGEWGIGRGEDKCAQRMIVRRSEQDDQLIFEFPRLPPDLSGPDAFRMPDANTLMTTGWTYRRTPNGTVTMQPHADAQDVMVEDPQELSICAS